MQKTDLTMHNATADAFICTSQQNNQFENSVLAMKNEYAAKEWLAREIQKRICTYEDEARMKRFRDLRKTENGDTQTK